MGNKIMCIIVLIMLMVLLIISRGHIKELKQKAIPDTIFVKDFKQLEIIDSLKMELYNCDVELAQHNMNLSIMDKIIVTLIHGTKAEKKEIEEHYSLNLLK